MENVKRDVIENYIQHCKDEINNNRVSETSFNIFVSLKTFINTIANEEEDIDEKNRMLEMLISETKYSCEVGVCYSRLKSELQNMKENFIMLVNLTNELKLNIRLL